MIQYIFDFPDCTYAVNTDNDNFGSLRYTIECAAPGDTIEFSPLLIQDSIGLSSEPLIISKDLYLNGSRSGELFVEGSLIARAFQIDPGYLVSINGLKIITGTEPTGSGAQNDRFLTLIDVDIFDPNNISNTVTNNTISSVLTIQRLVLVLEN